MTARPAPSRRGWLTFVLLADRRHRLILAVGLVALGVSLGEASVSLPGLQTSSDRPATSPPVGQIDISENWTDPAEAALEARLFVQIGTTAGYVATSETTALCVHVANDSDVAVEGAMVDFAATAGTLKTIRKTTDGSGRACTDFAAPDVPGQVIVSANVTYGSLGARAWNTVEVFTGATAPAGMDPWLLLSGASAVLLGMTLLAVSTGPVSAKQSRLRAGSLLLVSALVLAVAALAAGTPGSEAPGDTDPHGQDVAAVAVEPAPDVPVLAAGLVGLGAIAFATGMGLRTRLIARPGGPTLLVALTLLYFDGAIHWLAVGEHAGVPLHQVFFLAVGGLQVAVAVAGTRTVKLLWWVGGILTWLWVAVYIGTRVVAPSVPALFAYVESFDALGLVSKVAEVGLLVCLGFAYRRFGTRLVGPGPAAPRRVRSHRLSGARAGEPGIP